MKTTDEIMELACIYADSTNESLYESRRVAIARRDLRTAIEQLVAQAKWAHHTPKLLSEADAAVDLAGVARPGAEPVKLEEIEQYRMQMAGISTAALGYWKEGDGIHPDYDTPALRFVAKLYADYTASPQARQPLTKDAIRDAVTAAGLQYTEPDLKVARAIEQALASQDTDTQAVLIEGVEYHVPMPVAAEMLRLCIKAAQDAADAERDVLAERERQKSAEGWTPEHDDEQDEGELACAAAGYALAASDHLQAVKHEFDGPEEPTVNDLVIQPLLNPWPYGWVFKPAPARRMLVKAGALIIAEIERLDRAAIAAQKGKP